MRPPLIARALGIILIAYGCVLLLPALLAWIVDENLAILPFVAAALVATSTGMCCFWYGRDHRDFDQLRRTEGLSIVALTWTLAGLFGGGRFCYRRRFRGSAGFLLGLRGGFCGLAGGRGGVGGDRLE
jgi:Trk-type K+ transport system membrane component